MYQVPEYEDRENLSLVPSAKLLAITPYCKTTYPLDRLFVSGAFDKECIYLCMAIASSPAGPVLAGLVFMVIFGTAHV